jgi:hypothetical protein
MHQESWSLDFIPGRPIPKKKHFFTASKLILLGVILFALICIVLTMTGVPAMLFKDPSLPVNQTLPNVVVNATPEIQIPSTTAARVYDLTNASNTMEPVLLNSTKGNETLLYENNISYIYYSFFENTTLKAVNIQPVTELIIEYNVPNVTVKKILVDKQVIDKGILISQTYKTVYVTYPDPEARCEVKIYDDADKVVYAGGFGGQYASGKTDMFDFLSWGNYTIEMTGKRIDFNVSIIEK